MRSGVRAPHRPLSPGMATLTLNLAEQVKVRAEAQSSEAGFSSVDEYIASLIWDDTELEIELRRRQGSAPSVPLTPELLIAHLPSLSD